MAGRVRGAQGEGRRLRLDHADLYGAGTPGGPPPPPSGKRLAVIALVVAAVLVVAGGTWCWLLVGGDKGYTPTLEKSSSPSVTPSPTGPVHPYGEAVGLTEPLETGDCVKAVWSGTPFKSVPNLGVVDCVEDWPDGQVVAVDRRPLRRRPAVCPVPYDDAAAGGQPQARLRCEGHDADRAEAVRERLHHVHAYGLHDAERHRRHRGPCPGHAAVRGRLPARPAPHVRREGQERAGGARGDPPLG
ncbi:hypothetical protein STANM309S_01946 [Streptomyces tanashiensis]